MDYVRLGSTGLKVSRLCLGCMTYGTSKWRPWVLDEGASRPFIKRALEQGISFFDTADVYSLGVSEEVLGRALKDNVKRHEVVIATKVRSKMGEAPNEPNGKLGKPGRRIGRCLGSRHLPRTNPAERVECGGWRARGGVPERTQQGVGRVRKRPERTRNGGSGGVWALRDRAGRGRRPALGGLTAAEIGSERSRGGGGARGATGRASKVRAVAGFISFPVATTASTRADRGCPGFRLRNSCES